jgi:Alba
MLPARQLSPDASGGPVLVSERKRPRNPASASSSDAESVPSPARAPPPAGTGAASGATAAAADDADGDTDDPDAILSNPAVYRVLKRAPLRGHPGPSDMYVTRGARFCVLVSRALKCLRAHRVVRLHALGAALQRCADVALVVQEKAGVGAVVLAPTTDTVFVIDDYEPLVPGYPARSRRRPKSALHVTVTATKEFI